MKIKRLYRFERIRGGITISPNKPDCEYTELIRLVADENKSLTIDGENLYSVIDTDLAEGWYEIDTPETVEVASESVMEVM